MTSNYNKKLEELGDFAKVAKGSMNAMQFSATIKERLGRKMDSIDTLYDELKAGKLKASGSSDKPAKVIDAKPVPTPQPASKDVEHVRVVEKSGAPVQVLVQTIPSANHELLITGTAVAVIARGLAWLQPYALGLMTGLVFAPVFKRLVG